MKRFWILLICALLLCGCEAPAEEATEAPTLTQETTAPTQPPRPWTEEVGMAWDSEGALLEIPLAIPDGMHYNVMTGFDGDLLLWSVDEHLENICTLELCVVDLDGGSVKAQKDFSFDRVETPQVLGNRIYLCDTVAGTIVALDGSLNITDTWATAPCEEGTWVFGADGTLYIYEWDSGLTVRSLAGGIIPELPATGESVSNFYASEGTATLEYYDPGTGEPKVAFVNLMDGTVTLPEVDLQYDTSSLYADNLLLGKYSDSHTYYLSGGGELRTVKTGQDMLSFLPEGYILRQSEETGYIGLYDPDGTAIAGCRVSEIPYGYTINEFIWNPGLEGYFLAAGNYGGDQRLLFWDIRKGTLGEDLAWESVPEPSGQEAAVKQHAAELEEKYGVTIFIGEECDTVFDEFYATQVTDWERVSEALDTLDRAFSIYPEGFLRQLRYGDVRGIRIHLITDLQADGSGRYGGGYNAFTQERWDHNLMVVDIDASWEITYYHEITHIMDNLLNWDYQTREETLFSEEDWASLNPEWFSGYSYDYSIEHSLQDDESFVDGYATISPTEDRARIMEYAMCQGSEWLFEDAEVLLNKLDYYCRCIRDTFNTEGWPDETVWEQYLDLNN